MIIKKHPKVNPIKLIIITLIWDKRINLGGGISKSPQLFRWQRAGSIARNIGKSRRWAYRKRNEAGEVILNTGLMLGYTKAGKDENGHAVYEINEQEAAIVRRIYSEFVSGISVTRICRGLEADGIPTKLGKKRWQHSVIESILANEKYTGNAILGKTYKADVLTKYRQKNTGQAPMYYVENTHPAIIEKELFDLVQAEMNRRRNVSAEAVGSSKYTSKHIFSGMLICGVCHAKLRRHTRRVGSGKIVPAFGCSNRIVNGRSNCDSHHINEDVIMRTYKAAIRDLSDGADEIIETVKNSTAVALETQNKEALHAVEAEIIEIQQKVIELHKAKQQMQVSESEYAAQVKAYKARMTELEARQTELSESQNRFTEISVWLRTFTEQTDNFDEEGVADPIVIKTLIDHIVMNSDDMEIYFKCGARIVQKYEK